MSSNERERERECMCMWENKLIIEIKKSQETANKRINIDVIA